MKVDVYIKNWMVAPISAEHAEMHNWLIENTDGKWCHWIKETSLVSKVLGVTLYSEKDAIMFKLKFGL